MLRILWNAAAILSLLLCLAAVVLWIRGYFVQDWWWYQHTDSVGRRYTAYNFGSNRGLFQLSMADYRFKAAGRAEEYAKGYFGEGFSHFRLPAGASEFPPRDTFWRKLGFLVILRFNIPGVGGTYSFPAAVLPHWFVVLLSGILPACWFVQARRRR